MPVDALTASGPRTGTRQELLIRLQVRPSLILFVTVPVCKGTLGENRSLVRSSLARLVKNGKQCSSSRSRFDRLE